MVSPESGPQIQFTHEDTSENPYESVLARYEEIVGHRNPLPIAEAARIIVGETESPRTTVHTRLTFLIKSLNLEDRRIPPNLFMYDLDSRTDKARLIKRFGWGKEIGGLSLTQAARVLGAITDTDVHFLSRKIRDEITETYPSIKHLVQKITKPQNGINIPARFFLKQFDALLPEEERFLAEAAIRKYHLSPSEYAVLLLTARSKTNKEIDEFTGSSKRTARNHLHNSYTKLGEEGGKQVYSRTQAAILALKEGLLPTSLVMTIPTAQQTSHLQDLSEREHDILVSVAQGLSNREIALSLRMSYKTIANHLTSIFQKTGCRNRTAAALIYHLNALQNQTQE